MTRYQRYYRKHRDRILHRYDDETPEHRAHRLALHRKHNRDSRLRQRERIAQKNPESIAAREKKRQALRHQGKDISYHTNEYYREYRRKNREKILAQEKERRANRTPEQKAARAAYKKAYQIAHNPNYGVGRGHGHHRGDLSHMSAEESKAHKRAQHAQWCLNNKEKLRASRRRWYYKNHEKALRICRESRLRFREMHYQEALAKDRIKNRKQNDKTRKRPYIHHLSRRIPEYVTCPAEARHLALQAAERRAAATVPFATAIQSGLTVGRFSA